MMRIRLESQNLLIDRRNYVAVQNCKTVELFLLPQKPFAIINTDGKFGIDAQIKKKIRQGIRHPRFVPLSAKSLLEVSSVSARRSFGLTTRNSCCNV